MKHYNKELLDMNIKKENMEERIRRQTLEYHKNLLMLLQSEKNKNNKNSTSTIDLYSKVCKNFESIISSNAWVINQSMDIAKLTLEEAFDRCGISSDNLLETKNYE